MGDRPITRKSHSQIYDPIRQKYVAHTPEEYVRQALLNYLLQIKGYPRGLISVEKTCLVNGQKRRYDIVVFKPDFNYILLAECKAPTVDLSSKNDAIVGQVLAYNLHMQAPYLVLSNGHKLLCFIKQNRVFQQIPDLPHWTELEL